MKPLLEDISKTGVNVIELDIESNMPIVQFYNITGVPTIVLFDEGMHQGAITGSKTKQQIIDFMKGK
jgi:thioredoxin-like negative regulator of GroEL